MKKSKFRLSSFLVSQKISKSLTAIFFVIFLIPVISIFAFYIIYLYRSMQSVEMDKVHSSLEKTESDFNSSLQEASAFSDRLFVNKKIQTLLLPEYKNIQDVYSAYSELSFLEDYLRNYKDIANFRIYVKNETLLDNSYIIKTTKEISKEQWYTSALYLKGHSFWQITYDRVTKKQYLSLVRSLWDASYQQIIGVLVVNMNPETIQQNMSKQLYETLIYLNDTMVYSTASNISAAEINELPVTLKNHDFTKKYIRSSIQESNVGLFAVDFIPYESSELKFKIVYIIPLEQLMVMTRNNIFIALALLLTMLIFAVFMFIIYTGYIRNRVTKVQRGIEKIVENNFEIEESIGGNDEFEIIYRNLYSMSENIKKLIDEVYQQNIEKEQIKAAQSEISFKMLSSQINPHFLFNSIETIRMKSLASGDKDVSTMLKLLAQLLRYNLEVKGKPVPLRKEIDAINNYLTIQHMRFGDRITYNIDSDFPLDNYEILPLLIQPIVENSFNHGLEDRDAGGTINIKLELQESDSTTCMIIKVQDNGSGMTEETLEKLLNNMRNGESTSKKEGESSIGLNNVYSRIKLYYKPGSDIEIESKKGKGTVVCLKLFL